MAFVGVGIGHRVYCERREMAQPRSCVAKWLPRLEGRLVAGATVDPKPRQTKSSRLADAYHRGNPGLGRRPSRKDGSLAACPCGRGRCGAPGNVGWDRSGVNVGIARLAGVGVAGATARQTSAGAPPPAVATPQRQTDLGLG